MLSKLFRTLAPVAILAAGTLVAACDGGNVDVRIGDEKAVPLAELDQSGPAPTKLVLAGPDDVEITTGDRLAIAVSGDPKAVDSLRFTLSEGTLGIMRKDGGFTDKGRATVRVTMPAPEALTLAGSGGITAASLADRSEVTIAGSGELAVAKADASHLELTIAGSGTMKAAGRADSLEMTVAGSGSAEMPGLTVDEAEITIAGAGDARFASDGKVAASILGSGTVEVLGRATCTVKAMGSGTLKCSSVAPSAARAGDPPPPPAVPAAPDTPAAPAAPDTPSAP